MKKHNKKFTVASLFCGAGGMDIGFEKSGFETIWANDINENACATHKMWSKAEVVQGDISKFDTTTVPETDVILGGFPCQGFSLAGPRQIDDHRNGLYRFFVKLVEEKQPYVFVAENVKGLLTLGNGMIVDAIIESFKSKGYDVYYHLLNASDYGVPQDRQRVIMVGFRSDLNVQSFDKPPLKPRVTLKEAIGSIDTPNEDDICMAPYSSRYMSRNRKRDWDSTSFTIPAMAKQVALHPSSPDMVKLEKDLWRFGELGTTRRLSWQEAAAIQTFPREMKFVGDLTSVYQQIGNAVPVNLASCVADEIYKILDMKVVKDIKIAK